jgi:outer membrane protein assembly factor BamE
MPVASLSLPSRLVVLMACALLAGGCVYRVNIPQGNYLEKRYLDQVTLGMTRSQVRFLLGTPMISDPFHPERWDYVYYFKTGKTQAVDQRLVSITFVDDKVTKIDKPEGEFKNPSLGRISN